MAKAQSIFEQSVAEGRFKHEAYPPSSACDYYEVVMKSSLQEIVPGTFTPIYGYNGTFPGPTFISQRDRTACIRFVNRTGNITSVHYHGGHTPSDSDGVPMMSFGPTDSHCARLPVPGLPHQRLPERQPVSGDALVSRPWRGRHGLQRL